MFERYTDAAKRAIFYARAEAINQNLTAISVRHILVGLTYEADSRACQIGSLKENAAKLRSSLGVPWLSTKLWKSQLEMPLDANAKKTLAYASQEYELDRGQWLDTDHLLRGLLRFPNEATQSLQQINLELDSIRAASIENRKQLPDKPQSRWLAVRIFSQKYWREIVILLLLLFLFAYLKQQG